ncbi:SDR family NAD(P)-dependent oxidoreductase [Nocardioides flavescens]|uniref:SDR family NAD(P)-dependent oxidoreductase n=1 Tax=Nocardioides flavescens TaxID=2691959 RepID=A0A6L7F3I2_9ACTN|nr:SDR family NAD(P)-dependent oxidoreductase [Nocardioides flavescens]
MHSVSTRPVVLVVGGTSGIGLAVAQRLGARDGADAPHVVLASRDRVSLARAAASLPFEVGPEQQVELDVTDAAQVERAVERVLDSHGRLDAVVTSAQVMAYGAVEQVPREVFEHVVATAVHGTANLARTLLPLFRSQGHGSLVVVGSQLGEIPVPWMSSYVTAKWGQMGLVRSLQLEVADAPHVHVSLVSPGAVDTPIYAQAASYAGSAGSAPPPVVSADRVAAAVVDCLEHPRRLVRVGPANGPGVLAHRLAPAVYDRIAPLLVRLVVLRGPALPDHGGNVLRARPDGEGVSGGWTPLGRLRRPAGRARWKRGER